MSKTGNNLQEHLLTLLTEYPNKYQMAISLGVSHGLIYRVLNGGNSPHLRRVLGIPKHPPRHRLTIDCPPELKARFDHQRGSLSRAAYLLKLLELDSGVGELEC